MKNFRFSFAAGCAVFLTLAVAPIARAQCGGFHSLHAALNGPQQLLTTGQARLINAGLEVEPYHERSNEEIIGFWHVKFISEGSEGIPDGTEVDAGYSQWHSDGTEIMNSGGRAPNTSNFCLGVWEKVEHCKYKLNHLAIAWDATGEHLVGPANIREDVTLDPDHEHFTGTFSIDQYDESGNRLAHVVGKITGVRIRVSTSATSIF